MEGKRMKFENIKTYNFGSALKGMRNPLESWNKSDSFFGLINIEDDEHDYEVAETWVQATKDPNYPETYSKATSDLADDYDRWLLKNGLLEIDFDHQIANVAFIGPNDMDLAKRLIKAGPEHRKFLRQIMVTVDITAPLFWFKEFDTYKIGTTANSTSTMHKLASKPITLDCFEIGDYNEEKATYNRDGQDYIFPNMLIEYLEELRYKYITTKDKRYWKELVRWLPESWLQTRTVTMNYENIRTMVKQRKGHKLVEWSKTDGIDSELDSFIKFAKYLPYADDFLFE